MLTRILLAIAFVCAVCAVGASCFADQTISVAGVEGGSNARRANGNFTLYSQSQASCWSSDSDTRGLNWTLTLMNPNTRRLTYSAFGVTFAIYEGAGSAAPGDLSLIWSQFGTWPHSITVN